MATVDPPAAEDRQRRPRQLRAVGPAARRQSVDSLAIRRLRRSPRAPEHRTRRQRDVVEAPAQSRRRSVLRRAAIRPCSALPRGEPAATRPPGRVPAARQPGACRSRGVNTLVERQMVIRQKLYRRRWARARRPCSQIRRARRCGSPASSGCSSSCRRWAASTTFRWLADTVPHCPPQQRFRAVSTAACRCHQLPSSTRAVSGPASRFQPRTRRSWSARSSARTRRWQPQQALGDRCCLRAAPIRWSTSGSRRRGCAGR